MHTKLNRLSKHYYYFYSTNGLDYSLKRWIIR